MAQDKGPAQAGLFFLGLILHAYWPRAPARDARDAGGFGFGGGPNTILVLCRGLCLDPDQLHHSTRCLAKGVREEAEGYKGSSISDAARGRSLHQIRISATQKKVFWIIFLVLSLMVDVTLPLMWGLLATLPIVVLSWWIAYRSDWF